jgi:hypothetical protein
MFWYRSYIQSFSTEWIPILSSDFQTWHHFAWNGEVEWDLLNPAKNNCISIAYYHPDSSWRHKYMWWPLGKKVSPVTSLDQSGPFNMVNICLKGFLAWTWKLNPTLASLEVENFAHSIIWKSRDSIWFALKQGNVKQIPHIFFESWSS